MKKDWDSQWEAIEREYRSAREAVDAASESINVISGGIRPIVCSQALARYRIAYERFVRVTEQRSTIFSERSLRALSQGRRL